MEHARHDVGVARGIRAALNVGGRFGVWEQLLLLWLLPMRAAAPDISLRAEVGMEPDLMQRLVEGRLKIGAMYTPQSRPDLKVEMLLEETPVPVSTDPASSTQPGLGHVLIDWGPEFYARHSASFPDCLGPAVIANIGWLSLQHILETGGIFSRAAGTALSRGREAGRPAGRAGILVVGLDGLCVRKPAGLPR